MVWFHDRAFIAHDGGKLEITGRREIRTNQDVRDVYTPGVARVCEAIAEFPQLAGRFTMIGRSVAICTNGTRVLGLGDIGPVASMPVMEGKALFYAQLVDISAVPILIDTKDVDEFVDTVVRDRPRLRRDPPRGHLRAGVLRDRAPPDRGPAPAGDARRRPRHRRRHDGRRDRGLPAGRTCASTRRSSARSAWARPGFGIAALIHDAGVKRVIATDPSPWAQEHARAHGIEIADLATVMREADVVVATTRRPGLITPDLVRPGQVILALTNPAPEIEPDVALAAGAAFAADGTSVNNVLGYPGIFRGALLAGASEINISMKRAAAWALAGLTVESELVPDVLDRNVHETVAQAVRQAAIDERRRRPGPDRARAVTPCGAAPPCRDRQRPPHDDPGIWENW